MELGAAVPFSYGQDPALNRAFSALLVTGAAACLILSFVLTPSPAGWGTHSQLFLAPCLFHWFTGLPCPFCGMTTAFAHLARGQIAQAFADHCLGPPAFALAVLVLLAGARGIITGRWPLPPWVMDRRFQLAAVAVVLIAWAINIARAWPPGH